MGFLGFTEGIVLGIIMACIFFVFTYSRRRAIRAVYSGRDLKSTVRRPYRQLRFLDAIGDQIQIVKLQGFLFFGTIGAVEKYIRTMLAAHGHGIGTLGQSSASTSDRPIRFLIIDFHLVSGIDFSAAEAFLRLKRLLIASNIYLIICGVKNNSGVAKALRSTGVWQHPSTVAPSHSDLEAQTFAHHATKPDPEAWVLNLNTLNEALEWCENALLESYYQLRMQRRTDITGK
jgi:SulP family sulfate permease